MAEPWESGVSTEAPLHIAFDPLFRTFQVDFLKVFLLFWGAFERLPSLASSRRFGLFGISSTAVWSGFGTSLERLCDSLTVLLVSRVASFSGVLPAVPVTSGACFGPLVCCCWIYGGSGTCQNLLTRAVFV